MTIAMATLRPGVYIYNTSSFALCVFKISYLFRKRLRLGPIGTTLRDGIKRADVKCAHLNFPPVWHGLH